MWYLLPLIFIYIFGLVNLFGIRQDLVFDHALFFIIGTILFFIVRFIKTDFFKTNAVFFYIISVILLILTFFVGTEVKGSQRWLNLFIFQMQTSELFKIFCIVFLAKLFSSRNFIANPESIFIKSFALIALPIYLIYKQPDLGSAVVVMAVYAVMIMHSSVPKKQIIAIGVILVLLSPVIWHFMHDYQRHRILSFIEPEEAASTTSYNMTQAIISVGSGEIFGKGLGLGKQSQLAFLPEYHTDFAYSSLVEQFGLIGGAILVILYLIFFGMMFYRLKGKMYSQDENKQFDFYYTLGILTIIIVQTAVNIGMNVGLLPIAGITLPFISYGGSSLMSLMLGLALIR